MKAIERQVWYHCGHCGSLFQSSFGQNEDRLCEVCYKPPRVSLLSAPKASNSSQRIKIDSGNINKNPEIFKHPTKRRARLGKAVWFSVMWGVILLAAAGLSFYYKNYGRNRLDNRAASQLLGRDLEDNERLMILNKALPYCELALESFLSNDHTDERSQYVANQLEMEAKMEAFYSENNLPIIDFKDLEKTAEELIKIGDEWLVSTRWKANDAGIEFDAIFRKGSDSWKLDWPHFSRYSDFSWSKFLVGQGPDEAEFRLFARRYIAPRNDKNSRERLKFVLIEPVWGELQQTKPDSSVFIVDSLSESGLLLEAAFSQREKDEAQFGSILSPLDPEGLVRIRVQVSREELGDNRLFKIKKIRACHWIDSDYPGFDLDVIKQRSASVKAAN